MVKWLLKSLSFTFVFSLALIVCMIGLGRTHHTDRLAYSAVSAGNADLHFYDVDYRLVAKFDHGITDKYAPTWSPDGTQLAYISNQTGLHQIYVLDLTTRIERKLLGDHDLKAQAAPAWSPDGRTIAFIAGYQYNRDIYLLDLITQALTHLQTDYFELDVEWSPDSQQIAFSAYDEGGNYDLFIRNLFSNTVTRLTNTTDAREYSPAWSPDGAWIAFVREAEQNRDLYVWEIATATAYPLVVTPESHEYLPAWSPKGEEIAYISEVNKRSDLYLAYLDHPTQVREIVKLSYGDAIERSPVWK
ncbi:MAG: DPP IV N-terminal domain-containing protein [Anaerolineae bacterium]|jgi:TolB protein|nr:DPP IV N-terminal domain-containing protein [Anaerolineae bacterium]